MKEFNEILDSFLVEIEKNPDKNIDDVKNILDTQPGFIHADWCGDPLCEEKLKEIKGCRSRCILNEPFVNGKCVCCGKDAKYHVLWGIQY